MSGNEEEKRIMDIKNIGEVPSFITKDDVHVPQSLSSHAM